MVNKHLARTNSLLGVTPQQQYSPGFERYLETGDWCQLGNLLAAGRGEHELEFSVAFPCVVGATDAEVRTREQRVIDRVERTDELDWFCASRDEAWLVGTPDAILQRLRTLEEIGVERVYLQHHSHADLESVALLGTEVLPALT